MAKITSITVGMTESVNTAPYTYVKPEISLTAEVGKGESYDEVFEALNQELNERMETMIEEIKKNANL